MNPKQLREQTIRLAFAPPEEKRRIIAAMTWQDALDTDAEYERWTHDSQIEPEVEGWRVWLMLAGRGFGKTRAGAEWIEKIARSRPGARIALVGATIDEGRRVMVEGVSGILAVAKRRRHRVKWEPSLGRLRRPNGSEAQLFSGDNPDGLRGPEHDFAWCDAILDVVVAAAVEEPARNDPPVSPIAGTCYLVGQNPTGAWLEYADHLAAFSTAGWRFVAPVSGLAVLVKTTETLARYGSAGWDMGIVRAARLLIDGKQVVGSQMAPIADPAGGSTVDAEARATLELMLSALRLHGLIASQ